MKYFKVCKNFVEERAPQRAFSKKEGEVTIEIVPRVADGDGGYYHEAEKTGREVEII